MPTRKVSLALEEDLLAEVREVVGSRGLSSYVNRALRSQLQHDRLAGLLAALDQEMGPVDEQVREEVRRKWPAPTLDRVPGSAKGKLVVPDDFDTHLEDFRDYT